MIDALLNAERYPFFTAKRPVIFSIMEDADPSDGHYPGKEMILKDMTEAIKGFNDDSDSIIRSSLERNEIVLNGPVELAGVNIYDARCYKGFITSTYFLMYRTKEESKMLQGNYVIRMQDEKTIAAIYRWV